MKRVMTDLSNSSSNCPFGLFLSEQICDERDEKRCLWPDEMITLASILFGAIPAEIVSCVLASTSARSCETTCDAVISCSFMYDVMLQVCQRDQRKMKQTIYFRYPSSRLAIMRFASYCKSVSMIRAEAGNTHLKQDFSHRL